MEELRIEYLPIEALTPYERNARAHGEEDLPALMESIRLFGFRDPIGVWGPRNVIVEGHGRWMAARRLGFDQVPVIRLDDMTDEERRGYALAHNRTAELSRWDETIRALELAAISEIDMSVFKFDEESAVGIHDDVVEVETPDLPETSKAVYGDVYQLGDHRLICYDCSKADICDKLLGGGVADLIVTDPPYNMNYNGGGGERDRKSKMILNDHMSNDAFENFLINVFRNLFEMMRDGASVYCFYKETGSGVFLQQMKKSGITFKQELIWVKNQIVLGGAKYQNMYEPFLMGCKGKSIKKWNGGRKQRSVIEYIDLMGEDELRATIKSLLADYDVDVVRERKPLKSELHPTMKPVRLLAKLIENSSDQGDVVVDVFGGSGSTLMACEQLNRKCYMSELDPKYIDVIIQRWENFTGKKAVKIN